MSVSQWASCAVAAVCVHGCLLCGTGCWGCGERETACEAHHPLGPGGPHGLLLWRISIKAVLQYDPVYRDDSFL